MARGHIWKGQQSQNFDKTPTKFKCGYLYDVLFCLGKRNVVDKMCNLLSKSRSLLVKPEAKGEAVEGEGEELTFLRSSTPIFSSKASQR